MVADQDRLIALCLDSEGKNEAYRERESCIRNFFQPKWGGAHTEGGKKQFEAAAKPHPTFQSSRGVYTWFQPKTAGDRRSMMVIRGIDFEGSDVTLNVTAMVDCRTHNGKAIARFKHELYDVMEDRFRVPGHAAALLMGKVAQGGRKVDVNAVSCIAEYFLTESGTQLLVECRDQPFVSAASHHTGRECVSPNLAGRLNITMYKQNQINRFWNEHAEVPIKIFCKVVQRLIYDENWQKTYFESQDKAMWYKCATSMVKVA